MKQLFFILALVLKMHSGYSNEILIENLESRWLLYNKGVQSFVPYTHQELAHLHSIAFVIKYDEFNSYFLNLRLIKNSSLFINNQLIVSSESAVNYQWPIDSIKELHPNRDLKMVIFSEEGLDKSIKTEIVAKKQVEILRAGLDEQLPVKRATVDIFREFYLIGGLIVMALLATLRTVFGRHYADFYSLASVFTRKTIDDSAFRRGFSLISATFYLTHSLLLGLLLLAYVNHAEHVPTLLFIFKAASLAGLLAAWISASLIFLLLLMAKFVLLWYISGLFALKLSQTGHFLDYLKLSLVFFMGLFFAVFLFLKPLSESSTMISWLLVLAMIFSFFRVLILFFKLSRSTGFHFLHLITYLCATELIPLTMAVKFFL